MPSFEGSDEDLLKVLAAHVKSHDWFSYNEPTPRGVKKAAKSEHNKLVQARGWLEGMRQQHDGLSFKQLPNERRYGAHLRRQEPRLETESQTREPRRLD